MITLRGTDWWYRSRTPILRVTSDIGMCTVDFDPGDPGATCPRCGDPVVRAVLRGSLARAGETPLGQRVYPELHVYPVASAQYGPCKCAHYPHMPRRTAW